MAAPVAGRRRHRRLAAGRHARRLHLAVDRRQRAARRRAAVRLAALGVRRPQRRHRAGHPVRPAPARLRPHAGPVGGLPRAVHVRPGDLPADLRRRHADRAARQPAWTGCSPRCSTVAAIAVLLIVLDLPLGLIALASLIPLWLLYRWFSPRAAVAFRRTRETVATMIVNIVETFNGIRAVQAFRREKRNDQIFAGLNDGYRVTNRATFNLQALVHPGHRADRQRRHRRRAAGRRLPGLERRPGARCADLVPALPAAVLRPDAGRRRLLQLAAVGHCRAGEDRDGAGRAAERARADRRRSRCGGRCAARCRSTR